MIEFDGEGSQETDQERFDRAKKESTRTVGTTAEDIACDFLVEQGYKIVKRNFHFGKHGEVDVIAKEGETLCFIEVKARSSTEYGSPEEAITLKKMKSLRRVAEGYLYVSGIEDVECRFDVVAIDFTVRPPEMRLLKQAF